MRRPVSFSTRSIKQDFFDYQLPGQEELDRGGDGTGSTLVEVNAWSENKIDFPGLWGLMTDYSEEGSECEDCSGPPVLPAIADTYRLLNYYEPSVVHYIDSKIVLLITELDRETQSYFSPQVWPQDLPSLTSALEGSKCQNGQSTLVNFRGAQADAIMNLMPSATYSYFIDGDRLFHLDFNILLPGHNYAACYETGFARPISITPVGVPEILSCSPEDGLLPIPEP